MPGSSKPSVYTSNPLRGHQPPRRVALVRRLSARTPPHGFPTRKPEEFLKPRFRPLFIACQLVHHASIYAIAIFKFGYAFRLENGIPRGDSVDEIVMWRTLLAGVVISSLTLLALHIRHYCKGKASFWHDHVADIVSTTTAAFSGLNTLGLLVCRMLSWDYSANAFLAAGLPISLIGSAIFRQFKKSDAHQLSVSWMMLRLTRYYTGDKTTHWGRLITRGDRANIGRLLRDYARGPKTAEQRVLKRATGPLPNTHPAMKAFETAAYMTSLASTAETLISIGWLFFMDGLLDLRIVSYSKLSAAAVGLGLMIYKFKNPLWDRKWLALTLGVKLFVGNYALFALCFYAANYIAGIESASILRRGLAGLNVMTKTTDAKDLIDLPDFGCTFPYFNAAGSLQDQVTFPAANASSPIQWETLSNTTQVILKDVLCKTDPFKFPYLGVIGLAALSTAFTVYLAYRHYHVKGALAKVRTKTQQIYNLGQFTTDSRRDLLYGRFKRLVSQPNLPIQRATIEMQKPARRIARVTRTHPNGTPFLEAKRSNRRFMEPSSARPNTNLPAAPHR